MAQGSEMTSIQDAMRQLLEDRKQREMEITEERRHQREETKRRMGEMHEQMALLQRMVAERGAPTIRDPIDRRPALKLTRLGERNDIEAFLVTFERTMEAYEVDTARWSFMLAPQLTGKAQQAYAAMAADASRVYDNLKAAILRRYNINADTYRQRFRAAKLKAGETPRELAIRLRDLVDRWTNASTDATDILDIFVKEQLINTMPEDVRLWVRKHKPKTSEEAGQLAEDFIQAGQPLTQTTTRGPRGERPPLPGKCPRCGKEGHWAKDCPKARVGGPPHPREHAAKPERKSAPSRCFHCQQRGHFVANCPNNAALYCEGEDRSSVDVSALHQGEKGVFRRGVIDGVYIKDILLDTGASRSMIREDILPPDHRVDGEVTSRCAHGDMVAYPLTAIAVDIGSWQLVVKAGVSRTLPVSVLLGRDVPELLQLLEGESSTAPEPQETETEDVLAQEWHPHRTKQPSSKRESRMTAHGPAQLMLTMREQQARTK